MIIMLNNILKIEGATVLNKEQQISIKEGGRGTCGYIVFAPEGFTPTIKYGVDRETAWQAIAAGPNGDLWCCDSCDEANWLNLQ